MKLLKENIKDCDNETLFELMISTVNEMLRRGLKPFQMVIDRYNELRQKETTEVK